MTDEVEVENELAAYIVPLQKRELLVPEAAVAEILPYEPLQRVQDTPDWFLGVLGWRGVQVPVVSFEMLTVARASFSLASVSSASLMILRALGGSDELAWFALVTQTLPRQVQLGPEQLFETEEPPEETELMKARFQEDLISIPDLDYVETRIRQVSYG